jgi:hypothetical protein
MDNNLKERLKESILHSVIVMIVALILLSVFILEIKNDVVLIIAALMGIAYGFVYVRKPLNKKHLILNSMICMIAVLLFGVMIGRFIPLSSAITVGFCVAIVDVISFTKKGENTMNAKVMSNKPLMSKLIVYGMSFKNKAPVPTKGLGDFAYYAILLSTLYQRSEEMTILILGCTAVFLGCVVNWIIVCFIYNKTWYKGFPATIVPFIMLMPIYISSLMK